MQKETGLLNMLFSDIEIGRQPIGELNAATVPYGLSLTKDGALRLMEHQDQVCRELGVVETGSGPLEQLILALCDSPYLYNDVYEETLSILTETFYSLKDQLGELTPDEEIIQRIKNAYNRSGGYVDFVTGTLLEPNDQSDREDD